MADNFAGQLDNSIIIEDKERVVIREEVIAPIGEPAIDIPGDNARLKVTSNGSVLADDQGNTAVQVSGEDVTIANFGLISGAFNGLSSTGNELNLVNRGTITSDSRAVDLNDGDGITVRNFGSILGTDNQRNGTFYVNGLVDDTTIVNRRSGVIDAGEGNSGDGISIQVGAGSEDALNDNINLINRGNIAGRGQAEFAGGRLTPNGSSGVRFFNGSGEPEATVTGSFINSGSITAEVDVGFLGAVLVEDGVSFQGTITNQRTGIISAPRNGLYIGNAKHNLTINNDGLIESGSRAVNLDGDNVTFNNRGDVLGTGNQRNGTVYIDGTGDDITINNQRSGVIDAGEGNSGDGISIQVGAGSEDALNDNLNLINRGTIAGRGQAEFAGGRLTGNGSSGVRFFNGSGEPEATVTGSFINSGSITAEVDVGFLGAVLVEDGVSFQGTITNQRTGVISAPRNGLYIGNANHDLTINNDGLIESGSRAVNLDGDNVTFNNRGDVLGTGNQRNGTVYIDGTGDDITINNGSRGVIDAGEGNLGDGISIQVGAGSEDALNDNINLTNRGTIAGRGQAEFAGGRLTGNGSSGVRLFNGSGETEATVTGSFTNSGSITAEVDAGFLGAVLVEDGVSFQGTITNQRQGVISAPRNGLYIGNANHDLTINNDGLIESGSRAVNLDGDNVTFNNSGDVLGTGNQRNGTVYIDGTGDDITINNQRRGVIDAGEGNSGSGVSVQVGTANGLGAGIDDLETSADITNQGIIQGRGDGNVPAGVRLFLGSGLTEATFTGDITNERRGLIASEEEAGILIESGVVFDGEIVNDGTIQGGNGLAIDAAGALGEINVINNGTLLGDVSLGDGNDTFIQNSRQGVNVNGFDGDDLLASGRGNDLFTGGLGSDTFRFGINSGQDIITDFEIIDTLDVSAIFDDIAQIFGAGGAVTQVGDNTVIDFGGNDFVTLENFEVANLSADNFFVG
ncbi:MAG: calcium-binding protein [Symploca sp. SIO2C1]|nr:calcium-binding protein [Symploca sp. SIO2C1]